MQAEYLVKHAPTGNYVLIAGSPNDQGAKVLHDSQMNVLKPYIDRGDITVIADGYTKDWLPSEAYLLMLKAIDSSHGNVTAVVASNDGMAGGAIQALTEHNLAGKVLVSGQDADLVSVICIAKGTQAKFSVLYTSGITAQAGDVAVLKSGFAEAGIQLAAQPETFNTLLGDTVPCKPSQSTCKWTFLYLGGWLFNGPGFEPTGEPLYSTGSPNNSGSYSNPTMDSLINATHTSSNLSTFDNYANYNAEQVPVLFLPWATGVQAVSNNLHNVTQNPLLQWFPQYWTCSNTTCH